MSEILAVRGLFSGPPLGMKRMSVEQMVSENPPLCVKKGLLNLNTTRISLLVCLSVLPSETHQPVALPDASPSGIPDQPPVEWPRFGAHPAGPGPRQAGPTPAE